MRIGILISTYQRSDGKTPYYLTRALKSISNQTHQNYFVILIGDHYENPQELIELSKIIKSENIFVLNLNKAIERTAYQKGSKLWCSGGVKAYHLGAEKGLQVGIEYFCHLDHDDYWEPNHLELIVNCIEKTKTNFIATVSSFLNNSHYPDIQDHKIHDYIPKKETIIKSAVCFNYKTIPHRFRDVYHENGYVYPSDADLWERIGTYFKETKQIGKLIGIRTCHHEEEGFEKNNYDIHWLNQYDISYTQSVNDNEALRYLIKGYHEETVFLKKEIEKMQSLHTKQLREVHDLTHTIDWMKNTIYWKIRSVLKKITGGH